MKVLTFFKKTQPVEEIDNTGILTDAEVITHCALSGLYSVLESEYEEIIEYQESDFDSTYIKHLNRCVDMVNELWTSFREQAEIRRLESSDLAWFEQQLIAVSNS